MIVRRLCEKYNCLPTAIEDLTLDQIFLLSVSEDSLERAGSTYRADVSELRRGGLIHSGGGSLVQRVRAAQRRELAAQQKAGKRERRERRRRDLIEYKRQRGEL